MTRRRRAFNFLRHRRRFFTPLGGALLVTFALANPTLTVQRGDTAYALSKRYTTSWPELERLNPGLGEQLQLGQTLNLPPNARYVVQTGDDLAGIAARHGLELMDLMIANDFITSVRVGDQLNLSPAAPSAGAQPGIHTATQTGTQTGTHTGIDPGSRAGTYAGIYEVKRGDTLYSLARHLGTTVDELRAANLLESDALEVGDILFVPGIRSAGAAPAAPATPALSGAAPENTAAGTATPGTATPSTATSATATPGTATSSTATSSTATPGTVTVAPGDTLWSLAQRHSVSVQDLQLHNNLPDANLEVGLVLKVPQDSAVGGAAARTVTVQAGDTLHSLALRHNISVLQLMESNDLRTANLRVGQRLTVYPRQPGAATAPASLQWPLQGIITSRFGYRTLSSVGRHHHYGLDIAAPMGTPVRAAAGGLVIHSGWMGNYGNLVIIRGESADYYYAHHSQLLVQQGERVTAGDVIARVGSTGFSTGPHLHFEVRVGGKPVDPLSVLPPPRE